MIEGFCASLGRGTDKKAKTMAAWMGLTQLQHHKGRNMILEGDSKLIIDYLNDITGAPWKITRIIQKCKDLFRAFSRLKV